MIITNRFLENIEKYNLVEKDDTIIIGASGGPDSQFLIYLFNQIKDKYRLNIVLAHLNHLHRKEASNDEDLVIKTGQKLGLDVKIKRKSMDDFAKINKISAEDAGRRLRYEFFNELAKNYANAKIAVAHNMNDQAETMLFRMARGTGLDGLAAMDYKSGNIIRPILSFEKSEILGYLDKNNISYAIDLTNLENDYTRNYIRNKIFPEISNINPNAISNFFRLSDLVKEDIEIINELIDAIYHEIIISKEKSAIKFDREGFEKLSDIKKTRVLRKAIYDLKGEIKNISRENLDQFLTLARLGTGKKIIKDDLVFTKTYTSYDLAIYKKVEKSHDTLEIGLDDEINFNGVVIKTKKVLAKTDKSSNIAYFDLDKLAFPLKVRTRRNGDRFSPLGMKNTKKIKDFFIDKKIDKSIRDNIPLVISKDEIIWIAGYRISENFKVNSRTKNILKIEVINDEWYKWCSRKSSDWWRKFKYKDKKTCILHKPAL